jgi:hypothetical protein
MGEVTTVGLDLAKHVSQVQCRGSDSSAQAASATRRHPMALSTA